MTQPAAEQLLNLADRAEKGLTPDEAQRLRDGINALTAELATMEHVAKGNKAHVAAIVPDLEAATQRAAQLEDLLRIANDTSNTSETERARAVERANRAEAHTNEVAERAAVVVASMGADVRVARTERDRYRTAWTSARQRAQAHQEGTLRHVADRDTWKGWTKKAEAERDAALARLHELGAALTDPEPSWQCPDCDGLVPHSQRYIHQEAEQRARAERAEAAIERVRALAERIRTAPHHWGNDACAAHIRAALDEHQEQP